MRFYINILTTYFPDIDPPYDVYYQQIFQQIELAEELGWECFMFNEHHFLGYGGLVANPAVLLATAAARTKKIRLGPCIAILPLRHPLHTRRRLRHGRRDFRRSLGVWHRLGQHGDGLPRLRRHPGKRPRARRRSPRSDFESLVQRARQPSRQVLAIRRIDALSAAGATASSADLGRRHFSARLGLGGAAGLSHHDRRPSSSAGTSWPRRRGLEARID